MRKKITTVLCLDIGNTHISGGVFAGGKLSFNFRYDVDRGGTSDQIGIFLRNVLRENGVDPLNVRQIAICSVVPHLDYSVVSACKKYFSIEPFLLQPGVKTGIQIKCRNPHEVGTDVIAEAVAAVTRYPERNIVVVDFGTATTFCVMTAEKEFLGGAIMPGMRLSMESLQNNTAKLPSVPIVTPKNIIGRTTIERIQTGLYYSQIATVKEIIGRVTCTFDGEKPVVIGTGGFGHLFADEQVFTEIIPNMVLEGLLEVLNLNKS